MASSAGKSNSDGSEVSDLVRLVRVQSGEDTRALAFIETLSGSEDTVELARSLLANALRISR
jgi:hypothetical protein